MTSQIVKKLPNSNQKDRCFRVTSLKKTAILILLSFISTTSFGQVGIGTTSPNADALLEIGDGTDTEGLLLPSRTVFARILCEPIDATLEIS